MKFGIVVCSRCKKAKVVDLSRETTKCHRCGKVLRLEKLRILYETDSEHKVRQALGLVNAEMDGKLEEFKGIMRKSMR
jgi:PHP family Zn ribbon phosphoesterase